MTAQNSLIERKLNQLSPIFQQYQFLTNERHDCAADRADVDFIFEQLTKVPDPIKRVILNNAFKLKVRRERNLYILRTTERIVSLLPEKLRHSLTIEDDEIRIIAQDCADKCRRIALHHNVEGQVKALTDRCNSTGLEPLTAICQSNLTDILQLLSDYCTSFGIEALNDSEESFARSSITGIGAIKRMCDKSWWNRRLRKLFNQAYEQAAIELTLVNKYKQIYASDLTVKKRKQQRSFNENMLSSMTVINDIGQCFSLKELSDLNVSNPAVRKAELMVRMRGFEELSKSHGHTGIFITITCPSKYHAVYAKSGQVNPKYQSLTPYQANQYLCGVWSRIRANWNRSDIRPYGF